MNRPQLSAMFAAAVLILVGCSSAPGDVHETPGASVSSEPTAQSPTDSGSSEDSGESVAPEAPASTAATESSDDGSVATTEPPADESAAEASGADVDPALLAACGLSAEDLALMQRDWERVVDSVGREDHGGYATDFVDELESLQEQSEDCAAGPSLASFVTVASELADSASDSPDYALYREAADRGNAWLDQLGVTADRLAAG